MDDASALAATRYTWRSGVGLLIGVICLAWVFRDIDPMRVASQISRLKMWWLAGAIVCDIASYLCEGSRWKVLLAPIAPVSVLRATQAVYAGLFVNEVLPLRAGEFFRAYLVSRWTSRSVADVIPSLLVARVIDAMWLAVAIGCTAMVAPLPRDLVGTAAFLGLVVLISVAILLALSLRGREVVSNVATDRREGVFARIRSATATIMLGLGDVARGRIVWQAAVYSLGIPILQALAFWLVMQAYGLEQPLAIGVAVFLIVHVGTAVPNAPANVGSFQLFTVLGLTLFGVNKTEAAGFSLVVFLVLTFPLWAIGLLALRFSGVRLAGIRSSSTISCSAGS